MRFSAHPRILDTASSVAFRWFEMCSATARCCSAFETIAMIHFSSAAACVPGWTNASDSALAMVQKAIAARTRVQRIAFSGLNRNAETCTLRVDTHRIHRIIMQVAGAPDEAEEDDCRIKGEHKAHILLRKYATLRKFCTAGRYATHRDKYTPVPCFKVTRTIPSGSIEVHPDTNERKGRVHGPTPSPFTEEAYLGLILSHVPHIDVQSGTFCSAGRITCKHLPVNTLVEDCAECESEMERVKTDEQFVDFLKKHAPHYWSDTPIRKVRCPGVRPSKAKRPPPPPKVPLKKPKRPEVQMGPVAETKLQEPVPSQIAWALNDMF